MAPSLTQILIVLLIVILLFGTKKLRNMGSDLGQAVKGFKKGMNEEDEQKNLKQDSSPDDNKVVEGEVTDKQEDKSSK